MDKKLANSKLKHILWMDLEMTGLSPDNDLILEVAAIVTDWNFKEIATFERVIKNKHTLLKKRLKANAAFWDANPIARDGLTEQNDSGKLLAEVEADLIAFIEEHFEKGLPVLLGGNSIHVDRRFIIAKWPKFDAKLHYRMLDVSAWKVVFEHKLKKKYIKPDSHRALNDIRGSIAELQYYLTSIK